jgi:hypothetical protein
MAKMGGGVCGHNTALKQNNEYHKFYQQYRAISRIMNTEPFQ